MPRPEKVQAVVDIREHLEQAQAVFVAEYAGLSVKEQQELRRGLRAVGGEFRIVKMTLARRAAEEMGRPELNELLAGPAGLAYAYDDPAATARLLRDFARDHARLLVKGALFGDEVLPPERVAALADLEPRPVLLARVAGVLQAPMARLAGLLAALPRGMATVLSALIDQKPVPAAPEAAPEPEAAAAAEEAPADAEQPAVEAEQPAVEAEQPAVEAEQPAVEAEQPVAEAEQPAVEAEQPAVEAEQPVAEAEQPVMETEQTGSEARQAVAPPAEEAATNEADQAEEE
jgi:large subunit ribosomal protein L10